MMAHSDVVPVSPSSTQTWTYGPFSGHNDGQYIWGRGSEDDKSNLVAILSVIELLLEDKTFKPARTVVFALGFDEEGGADHSQGARCLAELVLQTFGKNGIEIIVSDHHILCLCTNLRYQFDEGMAGIESRFGADFALPATSEKGYLDVTMKIDTPGGHSQEPPKHTASQSISRALQKLG
jgi:Gly-Xaa carboxypeptidase